MPEEKEIKEDGAKPTAEEIRKSVSECYAKLGLCETPSLCAPEGITFDFCWGARVYIPDAPVRKLYRVRIWDADDHHCVFDGKVGAASWVQTTMHYYRPLLLQIDDGETGEVVFKHRMKLDGQPVLISFPVETVGDTLAWFQACEEFRMEHDCKLYVAMAPHMRKLLEPAHPDITFIERSQMRGLRPYAFYQMGVNFDGNETTQPYDWRTAPLHWHGANLLGVDAKAQCDTPPAIHMAEGGRPIEEPYVCISSMASGGCKLWLNPVGWETVVDFLLKKGYRVIDIDGNRLVGKGIAYQRIPFNAEDWTGKGDGKELSDRARLIRHADFFIGVGSGLSWLAWCCRVPVVLISGFSLPWCEFYTPYRVYNSYVCHGCFNDVRYKFDGHDCFWCPKHKGDEQHLICSLAITPEQVISAIKRIPEYSRHVQRMLEKKDAGKAGKNENADGAAMPQAEGSAEVFAVKDGELESTVSRPGTDGSSSRIVIKPGDTLAREFIEKLNALNGAKTTEGESQNV